MANIVEFLSKDENITPEKARKSRQMQFHDKTAYVWMGILPLKKRVNRDRCSFATKQRMFGVFAIDEILFYRWTPFVGSRTLCHPGTHKIKFGKNRGRWTAIGQNYQILSTLNRISEMQPSKQCIILHNFLQHFNPVLSDWSESPGYLLKAALHCLTSPSVAINQQKQCWVDTL